MTDSDFIHKKKSFADEYPDAVAEWHPTLNGGLRPDQIAPRSNKNYYWLCDKGHTFELSADKRSRGQGCYYCSNRRLLAGFNDLKSRFPEDAAEWDYEKNEDRPEDYTFVSKHDAHWVCSECGYKWHSKIRDKVNAKWNGCGNALQLKEVKQRAPKLPRKLVESETRYCSKNGIMIRIKRILRSTLPTAIKVSGGFVPYVVIITQL